MNQKDRSEYIPEQATNPERLEHIFPTDMKFEREPIAPTELQLVINHIIEFVSADIHHQLDLPDTFDLIYARRHRLSNHAHAVEALHAILANLNVKLSEDIRDILRSKPDDHDEQALFELRQDIAALNARYVKNDDRFLKLAHRTLDLYHPHTGTKINWERELKS